MRQFAPITLLVTYPDNTVRGQCDQCGDGATDQNVIDFPTLYQVEIVGLVSDGYGSYTLDDGTVAGHVCRTCYERSKEREFVVYMLDGDDIMSEHRTLDACLTEVAGYLQDPDEYGRYAPFRITAQRDGLDIEHICTITMPAEQAASERTPPASSSPCGS